MSTTSEISDAMKVLGGLAAIEVPPNVQTVFAVSGVSGLRGALGTVYFTMNAYDPTPLVVIDWDVKPIETSLPTYIPDVVTHLEALCRGCRVVQCPEDAVLHAEPAGAGKTVMLEAHKHGYEVREIREDIVALDLEERATAALPYVHAGQVKLATPAFEKTLNFRGTSANHLRRQIAEYRPDQRADSAELLRAWCTGILAALT